MSITIDGGTTPSIRTVGATVTYTTTNSGSANYAGTIIYTSATIYVTTDTNGNISSSRSYIVDQQPVKGFARKATTAPFYKSIELIDTVDSSVGFTLNRHLVLDH